MLILRCWFSSVWLLEHPTYAYFNLNAYLLNKPDRLLNNCFRFLFNLRKYNNASTYILIRHSFLYIAVYVCGKYPTRVAVAYVRWLPFIFFLITLYLVTFISLHSLNSWVPTITEIFASIIMFYQFVQDIPFLLFTLPLLCSLFFIAISSHPRSGCQQIVTSLKLKSENLSNGWQKYRYDFVVTELYVFFFYLYILFFLYSYFKYLPNYFLFIIVFKF